MKEILSNVIGDSDWDDVSAGAWTKKAQTEIFNLIKRDGYKIIVLCEAVSKGSGCVKQQYSLISADDCVLQVWVFFIVFR